MANERKLSRWLAISISKYMNNDEDRTCSGQVVNLSNNKFWELTKSIVVEEAYFCPSIRWCNCLLYSQFIPLICLPRPA